MKNNSKLMGIALLVTSLMGCVSQPQRPTSEAAPTAAPTPAIKPDRPISAQATKTDPFKRADPAPTAADRPSAALHKPTATTHREGLPVVIETPVTIQPQTETSKSSVKPAMDPAARAAKPAVMTPPHTIAKTKTAVERTHKQKTQSGSAQPPMPVVAQPQKPEPKLTTTAPTAPKTTQPAARRTAVEVAQPKGFASVTKAPVRQLESTAKPVKSAASKPQKTTTETLAITNDLGNNREDDPLTRPAKPTQDRLETDKTKSTLELPSENSTADNASAGLEPETRIAMITKDTRDRSLEPDLSLLKYDEEHLPRTLPGGWVLDIRADQLGSNRRCLLYSDKSAIFDGYENSWVRLQVTTDAVVINSDSNLDASYPDQGLSVDGGALAPFVADLLTERSTYTKKPVQVAMANGSTLRVSLGFWPTWPMTKTQSTTIDLSGFKRAFAALEACSAAQ